MNKGILIAMTGMLVLGAHAALVGSVHIDTNEDYYNVVTQSGMTARTGNGNLDTRGAVAGNINFLAGSATNATYTGATLRSWSGSTTYGAINRYGESGSGGGIVTWDYDFTGVVNSDDYWALQVEFSDHKAGSGTASLDGYFYVSYNDGSTLTLDTANVAAAASHGAGQFISDSSMYTQVGTLSGLSGSVFVDITSIVEDAQANGGGIRLAYVDNNFRAAVAFLNESGIVTTAIPEPATLGLVVAFGGGVLFIRRRFMI